VCKTAVHWRTAARDDSGGSLASLKPQIVRAAGEIPCGRELTICYLKGFSTSGRSHRREALQRGFNFICSCEVPAASASNEHFW
jgi:hypothetical protein